MHVYIYLNGMHVFLNTAWQHHDYFDSGGTYMKDTWGDKPINWGVSNNLGFDHTHQKCFVFIEQTKGLWGIRLFKV